ncbi:uncharacterized protein K452DRAFT_311733 [Aplosporella prunicola CBS 121167]|uniref:DUF6604 domain-containing protein n=1 Tax=Aplosporella prunicola CBS 121167 TaxID=1176127 RepID=A0A6A6B3J5_9PEZI|nr:uncharacterized protein K452DRAFT_311733 [Aplosporella prunicola CBS 121167]KAF2138386.1 hypothetical protein K452DRAFT_311733 [Aplosporella prunicola CBS 121167]
MLPTSLTSRYRQYKDDTNAVASWLTTTAQERGYSKNFSEKDTGKDTALPPTSGKLKGKARKEARAAAGQPPKGSATSGSPYIVTTKDFANLAKYVVGASNVQVPRRISNALDRAITVRKSYSAQMSSISSSMDIKDSESNQKHNFFISVLENRPSNLEAEVVSDGEFVNSFSELHVDDPSEELQLPDTPLPTTATATAKPDHKDHKAELQQDHDDGVLAFLMLLKDYRELRSVIFEMWRGYRDHKRDLISVSITTNTAIDFARCLEEDVQEMIEKAGSIDALLEIVYKSQCQGIGEDPLDEEMNSDKYQAADNIFWTAHSLVKDFHGSYEHSSDQSTESTKRPYENLNDARTVMWDQLRNALNQITLFFEVTKKSAAPTEDNLMQNLREVYNTGKVHLTAAFAAHIFLCISQILGEDAKRGFSELQKIAQQTEASLNQALKFKETSSIAACTCHFPDLQAIIDQWVNADPIYANHEGKAGEPFLLMKMHPLLCGLWAYHLRILFHNQSLMYANQSSIIMDAAHLYNAVQQEKLLSSRWKDMETIYRIHTQKSVLSGNVPKDFEQYLRRFRLHLGYSATFYAKNKRQYT